MAITVTEVTQVRAFDYSTENPNGREEYYVFFSVDNSTEYADYLTKASMCLSAVDPSTSLAIPQYGEQLGTFPTYVRNVQPQIHQGQNNWWKVRVDYEQPDTPDNQPEVLDDDPENITVEYAWSSKNVKRKAWIDKTPAPNGPFPVVNSAGQQFQRLPDLDRAVLTVTITRKTTNYDPLKAMNNINKINNGAMTINGKGPFPAKTVKLVRWAGKETEAVVQKTGMPQTTVVYDQEVIVFEIDAETWATEIYDQGTMIYIDTGADGLDPGMHPITRNGQPVKAPQPMNGRGLNIFGSDGAVKNSATAQAEAPGLPEVRAYFGGKIGMLVFNFNDLSDFSDLGSI